MTQERTIYMPHTAPGQIRRRVREFVGVNPNQTVGAPPALTWVIEDEILLADGSYVYVPVGRFVTVLDEAKDAETFVDIDIETGESNGQVYSVGLLRRMFNSFTLAQVQSQYAPPAPEVPV